jgi:hypothetical protein
MDVSGKIIELQKSAKECGRRTALERLQSHDKQPQAVFAEGAGASLRSAFALGDLMDAIRKSGP